MTSSELDMETYTQAEKFWKDTKKEYIKMSDGAELLVYYTNKIKDSKKKTIFFFPGYATGVFSWSDLWDELYKEYNLYVFESREKDSAKVKWKHKGNMDRFGLDIKETIDYFGIDEKNIFAIGSSFGCSQVARAVVNEGFNPSGILFNGPSTKFILPRKILWLAYIIPAFVLQFIGIPIIKLWISTMYPKGFQRKHYHDFVNRANAMKWKKTLPVSRWNALVDYAEMDVPTWIVLDPHDSLHTEEFASTIISTIKNSQLVKVPDYNYMHHLPGAKEWAQRIGAIIGVL